VRSGSLQLLVGAVFLSALGHWLAVTALALHLEETTGSVAVAALFVALWSPLVVFAGPAGLLADRFDARRVVILASIAQAVVATSLAFSGSLGLLLLLVGAAGNCECGEPTRGVRADPDSRVGRAAPDRERARGDRTLRRIRPRPAPRGLLAGAGGTRLPLLVNAATFVAIAVAVVLVRQRAAAATTPSAEPLGRARDRLVFLTRDGVLQVVMLVAFASLLFMTASAPAEVFFAKEFLEVGDVGFGALWTSWFAGMAVGGLLLNAASERARSPGRHSRRSSSSPSAWHSRPFPSCSLSRSSATSSAAPRTGRRTCSSGRSSINACPRGCTGGHSPRTTLCGTRPRWSHSGSEGCSSSRSALAGRCSWPASSLALAGVLGPALFRRRSRNQFAPHSFDVSTYR